MSFVRFNYSTRRGTKGVVVGVVEKRACVACSEDVDVDIGACTPDLVTEGRGLGGECNPFICLLNALVDALATTQPGEVLELQVLAAGVVGLTLGLDGGTCREEGGGGKGPE